MLIKSTRSLPSTEFVKMNSLNSKMTENDSSADENENASSCCLIEENQRCRRPAGLASFSKRIQTKIQRKLKLSLDSSVSFPRFRFLSTTFADVCCYAFRPARNSSATSTNQESKQHVTRKGSEFDTTTQIVNLIASKFEPETAKVLAFLNFTLIFSFDVDFDKLQVQTLRRYKKFYKVSTRPGMNKAQLAEIISKHFKGLPIPDEKLVLTYFIYSVKHLSPNND